MSIKAEVTEIVICACSNSALERMATECFQTTTIVPDAFRCPCGHVHLLRPGIEKRDARRRELMTTLREDIEEMREAFNCATPDEVLHYVDDINLTAAGELLTREGAIHESCMNQSTADAFYALADRLGEFERP